MNIIKTAEALRAYRRGLNDKTLSFVPTMGALHEGHLALVQQGMEVADICIPYIFLNPKQFAAHEDLGSYPQTLDDDIAKLKSIGVETVYAPDAQEVYPDNFNTSVKVGGDLTNSLEGLHRPHFFEGVTTVVCKMLLQCLPDIAIFGEKDYQQLLVIKKMVEDLNIPVEVRAAKTIRDQNGLALSSRNAYLTDDQYKIAIQMNQILKEIADGRQDEVWGAKALKEAGFDSVDYCAVRDATTLGDSFDGQPKRVLAAATLGRTRLIDNMAVSD